MKLNEENFLIEAMRHYEAPSCKTIDEFEEDLRLFATLKRNLTKLREGMQININLILNQIIVLYNCFGKDAHEFMFYKINEECYDLLATFLLFLDRLPPDRIESIDRPISSFAIEHNLLQRLEGLLK